jgi:hypothetical protein
MLNDLFDAWKEQCCVLIANQEWIVWNFKNEPPFFEGENLYCLMHSQYLQMFIK